ncbi:GvpL/GvpF family gas vesicle protein [Labilibaculum euxinus]|uniref:Uncharacterized protein n=1 Tax=Labilibaculum euxinus TaxID=2686357 RepID=A0A7M4DB19_9BACT|nr:GvpL/GvpF family gas vesicle protein [Labilibaculum euxinus]MUP39848.1 hypothetical protein [Labilibaculum euxinus]MVB09053.1 hypothetical protein [Labilibaculum euxinus]
MGKLIYTIVSVKNNPEKLTDLLSAMKGVAGENLSAVTVDGISAIVSEIEKGQLVADRQNALLFAGIIENLKQHFTILPMRFGSVADSDETVKMLMVKNYAGFYNNLQNVENKFEFGLKIFCDTEKLKEELGKKLEIDNETSKKPNSETKSSVYREYVNKKLNEHRLEEILLRCLLLK